MRARSSRRGRTRAFVFVESREGEAARTPRRSRVRACVCVAKPAMCPKQQQRLLLFSENGIRTVAPQKKTRVRTRRASPRGLIAGKIARALFGKEYFCTPPSIPARRARTEL